MSIIARQSTARIVTVGPILDADGVAVTDAAVGDLKLSKNGAAPAALNGSATLTHRATGHYSLSLTTSDLDTVGSAEVIIDDTTNAMPVRTITVVEEAVYDALFAASAAGYSTITEAQVNAQVDTALADYDPPTNTEMVARTLAAADYATAANQTTIAGYIDTEIGTIITHLTDIKGATFSGTTDSLEAIRNRGDAAWITATGFSTHSAADVWSAATRTLTAGTNIVLPAGGLANITAWTVDITGSLSGSVGSVTGAVGSVTGNVGGNVVGSVASVTGNVGGNVVGSVASVTALTSNGIADAVLARGASNIEDSADRHSLGAVVMIATNAAASGSTLTAKKPSDDSTFQTYTLTTDANAEPATGVS